MSLRQTFILNLPLWYRVNNILLEVTRIYEAGFFTAHIEQSESWSCTLRIGPRMNSCALVTAAFDLHMN